MALSPSPPSQSCEEDEREGGAAEWPRQLALLLALVAGQMTPAGPRAIQPGSQPSCSTTALLSCATRPSSSLCFPVGPTLVLPQSPFSQSHSLSLSWSLFLPASLSFPLPPPSPFRAPAVAVTSGGSRWRSPRSAAHSGGRGRMDGRGDEGMRRLG